MRSLPTILAAFLAATLASCVWRSHEEAKQLEERSYLRFVGSTTGAHVAIVGKKSYSFVVDASHDPADDVRYAIDPDNYRVTVTKNGEVIVDRRIFVADGETREVRVP